MIRIVNFEDISRKLLKIRNIIIKTSVFACHVELLGLIVITRSVYIYIYIFRWWWITWSINMLQSMKYYFSQIRLSIYSSFVHQLLQNCSIHYITVRMKTIILEDTSRKCLKNRNLILKIRKGYALHVYSSFDIECYYAKRTIYIYIYSHKSHFVWLVLHNVSLYLNFNTLICAHSTIIHLPTNPFKMSLKKVIHTRLLYITVRYIYKYYVNYIPVRQNKIYIIWNYVYAYEKYCEIVNVRRWVSVSLFPVPVLILPSVYNYSWLVFSSCNYALW